MLTPPGIAPDVVDRDTTSLPPASPLAAVIDGASVTNLRRPDGPSRNQLLAALSPEELARIQPHLELVQLRQRESLFEQEAPIHYVYFPETVVVSLVSRLEGGGNVEIGTAGCEGMIGLSAFLADDTSTARAFAQIPGVASRVSVDVFAELVEAPGGLHRLLLRYTAAFLTQVAQTAACNAAHRVEERCARWLLMTHDRVEGDELPLTHEFLAFMLGVRRAGVTVAMRALQDAGIVGYRRGRIEIVDRAALEQASCECYGVVRAHFDRLLPRHDGTFRVHRPPPCARRTTSGIVH